MLSFFVSAFKLMGYQQQLGVLILHSAPFFQVCTNNENVNTNGATLPIEESNKNNVEVEDNRCKLKKSLISKE